MATPTRPTVATAMALHQVHTGLASADQRISDAAETVMSALIPHLRYKQAVLPIETAPHVKLLREFCANPTTKVLTT
jgi:hypothetical protein